MMPSSLELTFECKPADHMYTALLKSFGENTTDQGQKLEEFVARLEEERLKIDAFKRELPLCMQLLNNAMEVSRQQLQSQRANLQQGSRPVLEEFIPLKSTNNGSSEAAAPEDNLPAADHKANWMTSAQLWNQENQETDVKLGLNGKQRMNGGGFVPFSCKDDDSSNTSFPELALASNSHKLEEMELDKSKCIHGNRSTPEKDVHLVAAPNTTSSQTHRKARRCWSPDLHRRFVNALHMLGGSQVATPKQIRELMKVDGLTNDEVKSHLQKYRLHTRRPSPSPQTSLSTAPQVVVLGGIWVPPEYAAAAAQGGAQYYGTHHMPQTFSSATSLPQEIYSTIAPPPHHHVYNRPPPPPLTHGNSSFSESDVQRGAGDPSESIEDDKSESGSWKADSGGGDNGGDRKRVDGHEESNVSAVALKF